MTPIVSPWIFYFIEIVDEIEILAIISTVFAGGFAFGFGIYVLVEREFLDEGELRKFTSLTKKFLAATLVSVIVLLFTPTSNTITKMIVADNVTHERLDAATDVVEDVYNDILELFNDSGESDE